MRDNAREYERMSENEGGVLGEVANEVGNEMRHPDSIIKRGTHLVYTSRFVRVVLAQGPC